MTGVLFDLRNAIELRNRALRGHERCSYVTGNFFESVPEGADVYLLSGVVHDWDDDHAVEILNNCRKAMAKNGRLLILEMMVPITNYPSFSKLLDVNMMVMTTGRERTKSEFHALLDAAGLSINRIVPTMAPQSIIEAILK